MAVSDSGADKVLANGVVVAELAVFPCVSGSLDASGCGSGLADACPVLVGGAVVSWVDWMCVDNGGGELEPVRSGGLVLRGSVVVSRFVIAACRRSRTSSSAEGGAVFVTSH
jgi:hypothetical protein